MGCLEKTHLGEIRGEGNEEEVREMRGVVRGESDFKVYLVQLLIHLKGS